MSNSEDPAIHRMQNLIRQWEANADQRALFLNCYMMMTQNMLTAIDRGGFHHGDWVDQLLHRFAEYYFVALDAYDIQPVAAPAVWRLAFDSSQDPEVLALQKLILGVNAHINYDLVLTLVDLLEPEWTQLSESQRLARYQDHCQVNEIIGQTIDAVQDQVLEPEMPMMNLVDIVFGSLDEFLISRLITNWRESVWKNAILLLETGDQEARLQILHKVEENAIHRADAIRSTNWRALMDDLF